MRSGETERPRDREGRQALRRQTADGMNDEWRIIADHHSIGIRRGRDQSKRKRASDRVCAVMTTEGPLDGRSVREPGRH